MIEIDEIAIVVLANVITLVLVFVFAKGIVGFCRRSAYWGRSELGEQEVRSLFEADKETMEALRFLAKSYDVPIGLLRPDDVFTKDGRLWKYDSWTLSNGQDVVSDYLRNAGVESVPATWTVRDFACWFKEQKQGRMRDAFTTLKVG